MARYKTPLKLERDIVRGNVSAWNQVKIAFAKTRFWSWFMVWDKEEEND